jgi:hypothetical protein
MDRRQAWGESDYETPIACLEANYDLLINVAEGVPSGAHYEVPRAADATYADATYADVEHGGANYEVPRAADATYAEAMYAVAKPSGANYETLPHAADSEYAIADSHPSKGYLQILPGDDAANQYAVADRNPMYGSLP